ncbi:methyltransferase family protein [Actinomadura latina]|uniref:Isoprenylcysteine carboxylmethyltransferase family protein n=1 Tax=Actinomadura latina TaxID=163603 RepID=A0A846ZEG2_9ACTN|nr:isoprenylcysteine carboxylmethyltransferase family protein [Actinomadura latina]NKZ09178.1 isoprenylcysteine carboxylmethyltransferase family protein [Actinomadura latina]
MGFVTFAPRLLFAAGAGVLSCGIVLHAGRGDAPGTAAAGLLAAYLGWLLLEVPVTFRRSAAPPADTRTLVPYALARLLLVAGASLRPVPWDRWTPWLLVPAAVFAAGVALRQAAIRALGRLYSHHVVRQDGHRVVTDGPYGIVRHPAYAGMLLANVGFTAFFPGPVTGAALVLLIGAVVRRIRVEERALDRVQGYARYAAGRPRVLPGVW